MYQCNKNNKNIRAKREEERTCNHPSPREEEEERLHFFGDGSLSQRERQKHCSRFLVPKEQRKTKNQSFSSHQEKT